MGDINLLVVDDILARLSGRNIFLELLTRLDQLTQTTRFILLMTTHHKVHLSKGSVLGLKQAEVAPDKGQGGQDSPKESLEIESAPYISN